MLLKYWYEGLQATKVCMEKIMSLPILNIHIRNVLCNLWVQLQLMTAYMLTADTKSSIFGCYTAATSLLSKPISCMADASHF
jgi:hypothetical protein